MYYTDDNTWARKRIYYIYTLGRMTDVVNKYSNGTAFSSFTYTLDDLGRRIKKTYNVGGDYVDYAYDAVSQLLNENRYNSGDTLQYGLGWTYDNSGNRLVQDDSVNGQTVYNYSNYLLLDNAVGPVNTISFTYNAAGDTIQEMINSGVIVKTFAYDEMGRMNSFGDNSNNATYANCPACSAVNQRVSTNANNVYTRYFFDGNDVVADYASDATLQRRYLHLGMDETLYMEIESGDNQGTYYFFHDGLGSVTDILNSSGHRVNAYDYYAYGEDYGTPTEGISNRYKFANREHDTWSSNYYNRNRYYNSSNGRFGQRDSMGMGWYYYPTPTLATDPTGMFAVPSLAANDDVAITLGDSCPSCAYPTVFIEDGSADVVYGGSIFGKGDSTEGRLPDLVLWETDGSPFADLIASIVVEDSVKDTKKRCNATGISLKSLESPRFTDGDNVMTATSYFKISFPEGEDPNPELCGVVQAFQVWSNPKELDWNNSTLRGAPFSPSLAQTVNYRNNSGWSFDWAWPQPRIINKRSLLGVMAVGWTGGGVAQTTGGTGEVTISEGLGYYAYDPNALQTWNWLNPETNRTEQLPRAIFDRWGFGPSNLHYAMGGVVVTAVIDLSYSTRGGHSWKTDSPVRAYTTSQFGVRKGDGEWRVGGSDIREKLCLDANSVKDTARVYWRPNYSMNSFTGQEEYIRSILKLESLGLEIWSIDEVFKDLPSSTWKP